MCVCGASTLQPPPKRQRAASGSISQDTYNLNRGGAKEMGSGYECLENLGFRNRKVHCSRHSSP